MNCNSASREVTSYLHNPKEVVGISGYGGKSIGKMAIYENNMFWDRKGTMRIQQWLYTGSYSACLPEGKLLASIINHWLL